MVRYLFYTTGDLTYQSPLVHSRPNIYQYTVFEDKDDSSRKY